MPGSTKQFDRNVAELPALDDVAALEYSIAVDPNAHPVIPGTSGARKMRWARHGMGKRGGIRVIYFYAARFETVLPMVRI